MKELSGKNAFITGGGSGIGLALAKACLNADMQVVIADLRQDHLDEALAAVQQGDAKVHAICMDVSDRQAMAKAADEAEKVFGNVHLLFNNAGINIIRPITDATYEDFDWVFNVNLGGVVNGVMTFVPRMLAHGEGAHIVNTSSVAGILTAPGTGIYSATKFAIRGLSDALRYDLIPHRIGVSVMLPGTVSTRLYESEDNRQDKYQGKVSDAQLQQREFTGELFRKVLPMGMDAMEVAEKTLQAVRENRFYIITHPEIEQDVKESFEEMLAALPDEPPNPERLKLEAARRQKKYDILKLAQDF